MIRSAVVRCLIALSLSLLATIATPAFGAHRIALVIGNSAYEQQPLANPTRDAMAMAAKLEALGFDVIAATDADLVTMQRAVLEFSEKVTTESVALVFYAGHGVQANGRNYLLPVDATLTTERALRFEGFAVNDILEELAAASARVTLVILDACRNNPFEARFRGGPRGLAVVDAARGTLIAYATAPGSVASDGDGDNGLYTGELLKALDQPGLKVEEVFKEVRRNVSRISGGQQLPWESSSLLGDFVFNTSAVPTNEFAATTPAVIPATEPNRCDNLSGRWYASLQDAEPGQCRDSFDVEKASDDSYQISYAVCGALDAVTNIRGTGTFSDNKLQFKWRSMPCSGTTEYQLNETCTGGTGRVVKRGGLPGLCNVMVNKNVVVDVTRDLLAN